MKRSFAAAAIALAVSAGCAGGGASHVPPRAAGDETARAPFALAVKVPKAVGVAGGRGTRYVSPATNGAKVAIDGAGAVNAVMFFDLSQSSTLCAPNPDGSRTCTLQLLAPVGADTVTIWVYDQSPQNGTVGGNVLSYTTLGFSVVAGAVNTLPLTLAGEDVRLALQPSGGIVLGTTPQTFTITVQGLDADGNVIVAPGQYVNPITLSVANDPNHTLSIDTVNVTAPGTTVTLSYNGDDPGGVAQIVASAPNATGASINLARAQAGVTLPITVPSPSPSPAATGTYIPVCGNCTPTPGPSGATPTPGPTGATPTPTPAPTGPTASPSTASGVQWSTSPTYPALVPGTAIIATITAAGAGQFTVAASGVSCQGPYSVVVDSVRATSNGTGSAALGSTISLPAGDAPSSSYSCIVTYTANDANGNVLGSVQYAVKVAPTSAVPAPTGLVATVPSPGTIQLTWNPVAGATAYTVFYSGPLNGTAQTSSPSWMFPAMSGTYTLSVAAVANGVTSAPSAAVQVVVP